MEIIQSFFQFVFSLIGDFFNALIDAFTKQTGFNAEFGSERTVGSRFYKGIVYSKSRRLTRKTSYQNVMITGVTGMGKTTKLLLPTLYTMRNASLVINDPSKELFQLSSGHLSKHFEVRTLNFSDSSLSSGYNPLSRIKKPQDINKIAHLLTATTLDKGNSDPFWTLSVKTLLQILITLVMHQEEQYRNMANILHLLHVFAAYPEKVDALIAKSGNEQLNLTYKSFIATPEKTLQNIVASAKASLEIFQSPEVAKVTAYDTIDFDTLRDKPTALYLHISIGDQRFLSCLISIFFEQFYSHMLERPPSKTDLDCFCIIDEASSLYIPLLPLACANGRKSRLGTVIAVQSKGQLKTFYKEEAENIAANCVTKIHLAGQTALDELREIEALSGKYIYKDEKGTERVKPLITADEIRLLPENRSLIISGNKPIIQGRVSPYWRNLVFRNRAKIPPVSLIGDILDTPVPLLKL